MNKKEVVIAEDEEGDKTKQLWCIFDILSSEISVLLFISFFQWGLVFIAKQAVFFTTLI